MERPLMMVAIVLILAGAWLRLRPGRYPTVERLGPFLPVASIFISGSLWFFNVLHGSVAWLIFGSHLSLLGSFRWSSRSDIQIQLGTPLSRAIIRTILRAWLAASVGFYIAWGGGVWTPTPFSPILGFTTEGFWMPILLFFALWIFFTRVFRKTPQSSDTGVTTTEASQSD